jgi:hypothetical protein
MTTTDRDREMSRGIVQRWYEALRRPPGELIDDIAAALAIAREEGRRELREIVKVPEGEDDYLRADGNGAGAAASYALLAQDQVAAYPGPTSTQPRQCWRWPGELWEPSDDPIQNLRKSIAYAEAEIRRIQEEGLL